MVRSFRATIGTLAICSNSPAAMRRVIDVVRRQSPSLAESPEFRLMRGLFATDAPAEDVLLFFSESFLREQAGPRHRISLKRRANELQRIDIERRSARFTAEATRSSACAHARTARSKRGS